MKLPGGRATLFVVVLALCVGCDHTVKQLAQESLTAAPVSIAGDLIRFELAHNHGALLSTGAELPPWIRSLLFLVLVPIGLLGVCVMAFRSGVAPGAAFVGLALIVGGGGANWLDRLLHAGAVTDFVSLGLGPLRTGIFNVADVCIIAGVLVFVLGSAKEQRSEALDA
ncbi:MAG: signal peptidase II [Myxococcota bacterium]|nr:signal peptidase II [Myxococcota bacterium]